ncbi:Gibberellin 20 oxidase 3 [Platanthera zijinensis]|uniref:Gibberellin 20 oxidase 3 n=1 Tax=Platanthera zijinensis TaxID=2320716 RepID=A0AAP0G757_9ASPA
MDLRLYGGAQGGRAGRSRRPAGDKAAIGRTGDEESPISTSNSRPTGRKQEKERRTKSSFKSFDIEAHTKKTDQILEVLKKGQEQRANSMSAIEDIMRRFLSLRCAVLLRRFSAPLRAGQFPQKKCLFFYHALTVSLKREVFLLGHVGWNLYCTVLLRRSSFGNSPVSAPLRTGKLCFLNPRSKIRRFCAHLLPVRAEEAERMVGTLQLPLVDFTGDRAAAARSIRQVFNSEMNPFAGGAWYLAHRFPSCFDLATNEACLDHGFFYLTNHGIDGELYRQVFRESEKFFSLPLDAKLKLENPVDHYGYIPPHTEILDPDEPQGFKHTFSKHRTGGGTVGARVGYKNGRSCHWKVRNTVASTRPGNWSHATSRSCGGSVVPWEGAGSNHRGWRASGSGNGGRRDVRQ